MVQTERAKTLSRHSPEAGVGLIELMIVVSISTILLLGTVALLNNMFKSQRYTRASLEAGELVGRIRSLMSIRGNCLASIGGRNPVEGEDVPEIRSGASVFYTSGAQVGVIRVTSLRIENFVAGTVATSGVADLNVGILKLGDISGPTQSSATIQMQVSLTAGNTIVNCVSKSKMEGTIWQTVGNNDISFPNGNVAIGTQTPASQLHVHSDSFQGNLVVSGAGNTENFSSILLSDGDGDLTNETWEMAFRKRTGLSSEKAFQIGYWSSGAFTPTMTVLPNMNVGVGTEAPTERMHIVGNVRVTGTVYASVFQTSDRDLKDQIRSLEPTLEKVLRLRPVTYSLRSEKEAKREIGFIAQEVEPWFPELVNIDSRSGKRSLAYSRLSAVLTKAIQELKAENDNQISSCQDENQKLQKRIQELEAKIQKFESLVQARGQ